MKCFMISLLIALLHEEIFNNTMCTHFSIGQIFASFLIINSFQLACEYMVYLTFKSLLFYATIF